MPRLLTDAQAREIARIGSYNVAGRIEEVNGFRLSDEQLDHWRAVSAACAGFFVFFGLVLS